MHRSLRRAALGPLGPVAPPPLYPGHVATSPLEKVFIGAFSAFKAIANPQRADAVAALGETTGRAALERLRDQLLTHPDGQHILAARPVVDRATLAPHALASLPPGTFGRAYAEFLEGHGFDPEERDAVRFVDDDELAFVMLRHRQTHDFAHVLCGLPPTVLGELALKWFEAAQTGLPVAALSAAAGPAALPPGELAVLRRDLVPWALRAGRVARRPLLAVRFEEEFATPLTDLRRKFGIIPAPACAVAS